jgi:cytochrome c peroxidase
VPFTDGELARVLRHSPLPPTPLDTTNAYQTDPGARAFGQWLFFDTTLSGAGDISCATCHLPEQSWTDGRVLARGVADTHRNTPSLWNVAHNRWFFWDGRADSLWSQSLQPLENSKEHGGSRLQFAHYLAETPALREAYRATFGPLPDLSDPDRFPPEGRPSPEDVRHPHRAAWLSMAPDDQAAVNRVYANIGKSLAAYQSQIESRRAPFDVFVEGLRTGDPDKLAALDASAQRGLKLFVGEGQCHVCHAGPHFSDLEFHDIRVPVNPELPTDHGRLRGLAAVVGHPFNGMSGYSDDREEGRVRVGFLELGEHEGWKQFKTPTLRNVTLTAPYMHQGQLATLQDVLHFYSTMEGAEETIHAETILQPLDLDEGQVDDLIAFLESLTATDLDAALLAPPDSPFPR